MSQQSSKSASIASKGYGCLVILIFIGILFWSDRSSFLAKARHKKQLQARGYVYSMNKSQQAYFEVESAFATSLNVLGFGIKTETENYKYFIFSTKTAVFNYGVSKQKDLKSYVGGVFVIPAAKQVDLNSYNMTITTKSILCIADSPGTIKPPEPTNQNGKIACATGTIELTHGFSY